MAYLDEEDDKGYEALQERNITVREKPAYGFRTSSSPSETEQEEQENQVKT